MQKLSSFLSPVGSSAAEAVINTQPIIFTLLMLYQGLFSGNAIKIPKKLKTAFNSKTFRFISIMLIAFSATRDIEYAMISTVIFLGIMYALKTPEEREETGLI